MSKSGGYNPELFVERDSIYMQSLTCAICLCIVREAMMANNPTVLSEACGHIFCKNCIDSWLVGQQQGEASNCPTCRQQLKISQLKIAPLVRRMVADSKVNCNEGCGWIGQLGKDGQALELHLKNDCPLALVPCPWNEDHKLMERESQNQHVMHCEYRLVECVLNCNAKISAIKMDEHVKNECVNAIIKCPNGCELHTMDKDKQSMSIIKRGELSEHLDSCLCVTIDCPYWNVGCTFPSAMRHIIHSHLREAALTHVNYLPKQARATPAFSRLFGVLGHLKCVLRDETFYNSVDWRRRLNVGDVVDVTGVRSRLCFLGVVVLWP